jgi:serine/threonine-protein kinase
VASDTVRDRLEVRLRQAQADLERRVHAGEDCGAGAYLAADPELAAHADRAIDLIYAEFCARADAGRPRPREDYYREYPQWRDQLITLLELDRALDEPAMPRVIRLAGSDGRITQYEFLQEIARGPNGHLVKARDLHRNCPVAVKTCAGGDAGDVERFQTGAWEQQRLNHPHILPVHEVGHTEDGLPCFVMEFAEAGSLDQAIAGKPQTAVEAARLVRALALAMAYAHREGVIHRDLKPANIVLTADGVPRITDFGLARRVDAPGGPTRPGDVLGTLPYMAPEQAAGRTAEVGTRSDLHALGVILYELLTGRPPFLAQTALESIRQVIRCRPPRPRRRVRGVPRALESICLKCLEKAPARRYASAQELADDLGRWLAHQRPNADRPAARAGRALRWHPVLTAAAAFLLLTPVVTLTSIYLADPERQRKRIESALAAGDEVTLIDDRGQPKWHAWLTHDSSQEATRKGDCFSVGSWGLGLLELIRDPQRPHYSFSTWVRHDQTAGAEGTVGIYFAHGTFVSTRGEEHLLCTLRFNGRLEERGNSPDPKGNFVPLRVERLQEALRGGSLSTAGLPAYLPVSWSDRDAWRKFTVDVSPQRVAFAVWRDGQLEAKGQATFQEIEEARDTGCRLLGPTEDPLPEDLPTLAPRGSLGLYVSKGFASFRNAVIKPLQE